VAVLSLDTGDQRVLVQGLDAVVAPSGHLVFARAGSLWAAPFDVERLELAGDPVPVVQNVQVLPSGSADYGLASDGSLAYRTPLPIPRRSLVWVSRLGEEEPVRAPPAVYSSVNVSPDGTRIALTIVEAGADIWIWDVVRSGMSRLTADPGSDEFPVWSPDGQRLLFELHRVSDGMVYSRASDGTGPATLVNESSVHQLPQSVSADGSQLVVIEVDADLDRDIALVSLTGEPRTTPLVHTPFNETHAKLSPDGRWLAYHSNESGADEVYVRPFPDVDTARWQVSTGGGVKPLWNPDGSELFYWDGGEGALMAVPVATSPPFSAGTPTRLFKGQYYQGLPHFGTYDVAPDGQRFLMIKDDGPPDDSANPSQIVLVQNWLEELKARVPTN
jgi:serine/threonine-protein kinase